MRPPRPGYLALFLLVACSPHVAGGGAPLSGSIVDDINDIATSLAAEPAEIVSGDGARLVFSIDNVTEREVRIRFPDSRQARLLVYEADGGEPMRDDFTITLPAFLTLGPLETWKREIEWDGRIRPVKRNPVALEPGAYELKVELRKIDGLFVNGTNRVPIVVR